MVNHDMESAKVWIINLPNTVHMVNHDRKSTRLDAVASV